MNIIVEIDRSLNTGVVNRIDGISWKHFYITLLSVLFGLLIEWNRVLTILKGHIKVNRLFIPSILLLLLSFTPIAYTLMYFGFTSYRHFFPIGVFITPLQSINTLMLLGVLSGVLLVRSLAHEK